MSVGLPAYLTRRLQSVLNAFTVAAPLLKRFLFNQLYPDIIY